MLLIIIYLQLIKVLIQDEAPPNYLDCYLSTIKQAALSLTPPPENIGDLQEERSTPIKNALP
ncbi:hypothetical protein TcasGA2_TC007599 [Tribolium castaneum]|uniref:Uncharacterized protein n=1 Tax=Tribolium castaneum TaxID=7070 RepID=D2A2Z7_TRICA|nr:hypothetical protein TcasGA2_TC007599 [Tribolium castaneum]